MAAGRPVLDGEKLCWDETLTRLLPDRCSAITAIYFSHNEAALAEHFESKVIPPVISKRSRGSSGDLKFGSHQLLKNVGL